MGLSYGMPWFKALPMLVTQGSDLNASCSSHSFYIEISQKLQGTGGGHDRQSCRFLLPISFWAKYRTSHYGCESFRVNDAGLIASSPSHSLWQSLQSAILKVTVANSHYWQENDGLSSRAR